MLSVDEIETSLIGVFRKYRGTFFDEICGDVEREINNSTRDLIELSSLPQFHACTKCFDVFRKELSICPICGHNKDFHNVDHDPYFRVPSRHNGKSTVIIGEPCMVNPASEESLEEVVKHVRSLSLQDGRKWTILHSDGIPYVQLSRCKTTFINVASVTLNWTDGVTCLKIKPTQPGSKHGQMPNKTICTHTSRQHPSFF